MEDEVTPSALAAAYLAAYFHRNGYLRLPNRDRRQAASRSYKKGYEVRLVANSETELATIRHLLRAVGFEPGRAFVHASQWRQPIYGRQAVARFLVLIGWKPDA